MPTAAESTTAPADPLRSFVVTPMIAALDGTATERNLLDITAPSRATAAALSEVVREGRDACRALLLATREEFFATGPGADLRAKETRLAAAERDVESSTCALAQLREEWRSAVAADTAKDVVNLEAQIDKHERNLDRLTARVSVLRVELAAFKKVTANRLYSRLQATRTEYHDAAAARLVAAREKLTEAVNSAWAEFNRAQSELHGSAFRDDDMMRLSSVAAEVPKKGSSEFDEQAVLPDPSVPPARTEEERRRAAQKHRPFGPPLPVQVTEDRPPAPLDTDETVMRTEDGRPVVLVTRTKNEEGRPVIVEEPLRCLVTNN